MEEITITYANLRVSPFIFVQLQTLDVVKVVNEHTRMKLEGIIPEEYKDQYVTMAEPQSSVKLELINEKTGNRLVLFQGIIVDIEVRMIRGIYYLSVEAVSYTYLLDVKRKNRSFQNPKMTYSRLIHNIVDDYAKADATDLISRGKPIGSFIMQYEETDWQFLKRMASHFYTVLVPASSFNTPKLYFGLPQLQDKGELKSVAYTVKKRLGDYQIAKDNQVPGVDNQDFTVYEVETDRLLELGQEVTFKGRRLVVGEAVIRMKNGILTSLYKLYPRDGLNEKKTYNLAIIGASIQAKVLKVKQDTVQAKLDMDDQEEDSMDYWFPYSTIYASEGNTGWYCMPEIGDSIRIYFPSKKESQGIAISSVKRTVPDSPASSSKAPAENQRMSNPDVKSLRTKYGKEIVLDRDKIVISGNDMSITLSEKSGIDIVSNKNVSITAATDITMKSSSIHLSAAKLELSGKDNTITLEDKVLVKGSEIKMN